MLFLQTDYDQNQEILVQTDNNSNNISLSYEPPWYNSDEYWPVWIGIIWFVGVVIDFWLGRTFGIIHIWATLEEFQSCVEFEIAYFLIGLFFTAVFVHCCTKRPLVRCLNYILLCAIAFVCKIIGKHKTMQIYGLGDSFWAILFGCILGNVCQYFWKFKINHQILSLEFFIKVGIVMLAINATRFAEIGVRGILIAWCETVLLVVFLCVVGYHCFHLNKHCAIVTACGVSICGSSAIMAIGDAIRAPKEMMSSLIAIMSIFTVPLIPLLPILGRHLDLSCFTVGAWIGGSIDSTGGVIASASLLNVSVFETAVVIKMLQNILIGPVTLAVTVLVNKTLHYRILWDKFPKFVLGFAIVCIATTVLNFFAFDITSQSFTVSEWFSCISFVLIGVELDIFTLRQNSTQFKRVWGLYLFGQIVDICTTLGVALLVVCYTKP